jgi:class 3 adenylate cyclase/pimeloyl-ACP methyl ester carboxylesterase
MGEGGVPLVMSPPLLFSHAVAELRWPGLRAWYERLAARRMIVRLDQRGQGLSQRDIGFIRGDGFDGFFNDLVAVTESLEMDQFDMLSFYGPCMTHIVYAARFPERVRRIVLWSPVADNHTFAEGQLPTVLSLIESDWQLFTETFARVMLGWTGDLAHEWASFMRIAMNQEDAANLFAAIVRSDVHAELPLVRASTLVLFEVQGLKDNAEQARRIAATIPGARLVPLSHKLIPAFESEEGTRAIEDFLGGGVSEPRTAHLASAATGTAIILFADIADSTALTERLGDAAFREKARELDEALRRAIASNGGTAIEGKLLGDGVLATFGAAREAIACAQEVHRIARAQSTPPRSGEGLGEGSVLLLHVGIHAGDIIRESNNVYGGAVNIAARVAGEAAAGETLVSATVRDLARTSAGASFEDRGERELKGVGEAVRLFAVRRGDAPLPFREGAGG